MSSNQIVYHNNIYNAYMYNIRIGIAQLNVFNCANNKTRKLPSWVKGLSYGTPLPKKNLLTGRFGESASRFPPFVLADLVTVTKSAGRCGESAGRFPPADLLTGRFGESAGRFPPVDLVNLPADFPPISAGRFGDSH